MRLNGSTQLMTVVGSLTAGEIAFNETSTICRTPNSVLLQCSGRAEVKHGNQLGSSFGGGLDLVLQAAK